MSESHKFETVDALQAHFTELYGERNQEFLHNPMDCVALFAVGTRDLRQALRAENEEAQRVAIARLGSRIFLLLNSAEKHYQLEKG